MDLLHLLECSDGVVMVVSGQGGLALFKQCVGKVISNLVLNRRGFFPRRTKITNRLAVFPNGETRSTAAYDGCDGVSIEMEGLGPVVYGLFVMIQCGQ